MSAEERQRPVVKPTYRFVIGDTRAVMASMPDASVDLVLCSPPFLALRSYLPADHPDKALEIGSEATPADFIDTLLDIAEESRRVLTPHGSLVFELGDTFSGSGGAGGDYAGEGMRNGQPRWDGSAARTRADGNGKVFRGGARQPDKLGAGWPMDKSLTFIPQLFAASLAYGRNLLGGGRFRGGCSLCEASALRLSRIDPAALPFGDRDVSCPNCGHVRLRWESPRLTEPWRIRNLIAWCRPNPPVGALGDKCRPATSYLTVATVSRTRWWDMDAVRVKHEHAPHRDNRGGHRRDGIGGRPDQLMNPVDENGLRIQENPAGAPLLDYWEIPTQPYKGSHYAAWPEEIARRCILLMCPEKVCTVCGEPSRRITETTNSIGAASRRNRFSPQVHSKGDALLSSTDFPDRAERVTLGWTDCGCSDDGSHYRPGIVLDPFAGSGTTLRMALGNGRSAIGIDLDARNAELALERVGPLYLEVEHFGREEATA